MASTKQEIKCFLMADVAGFSSIRYDAHLPVFVDVVLKPVSACLRQYKSIEQVNTWGDSILVICNDVVDCCRCALQMRDHFRRDFKYDGLPQQLNLRVAVHQGHLFRFPDPIRGLRGAMGHEIVTVARLEPRVAVGQVWATEQVRVAVESAAVDDLHFDPLGQIQLAKGYGSRNAFAVRRSVDQPVVLAAETAATADEWSMDRVERQRKQLALTQAYQGIVAGLGNMELRQRIDEFYRLAMAPYGAAEAGAESPKSSTTTLA